MDGKHLLVLVIGVIVVAIALSFIKPTPPPPPPPPTKPAPKAEEVGENLGDKTRRFGDGFLKGFRKP